MSVAASFSQAALLWLSPTAFGDQLLASPRRRPGGAGTRRHDSASEEGVLALQEASDGRGFGSRDGFTNAALGSPSEKRIRERDPAEAEEAPRRNIAQRISASPNAGAGAWSLPGRMFPPPGPLLDKKIPPGPPRSASSSRLVSVPFMQKALRCRPDVGEKGSTSSVKLSR